MTTRLRLMTGVIILPQRNPLVLAKQVATLDAMSGGRIELGVGVGWLREGFQAIGVPFERRGKRADEYVAAMRALWATDDAGYAGEFVAFKGINCNPKPLHGSVPIIVGGSTEVAAKRAGRLGDGLFPSIGSQTDILPLFDVVRRAATAAGRDPAAIEFLRAARCPAAIRQGCAGGGGGAPRRRRRPHRAADDGLPAEYRGKPSALRRDGDPRIQLGATSSCRWSSRHPPAGCCR